MEDNMALEVQIYGRNMEVTDRIQDYVDKKVSKLDRYLSDIDEARVDLAYIKSARSNSDRQVAQITVRGRGFILRSEERAEDIFAALDIALEKLQRQMERFKGKRSRGRNGKQVAEMKMAETLEEEVDEEEELPAIVRRKRFVLTPMDEVEALEQMALLGHENFFLFFNVNTNSVNVLYRRRDGAFGLIESELG
jgi:putative sigma-54 modulation protein